MDGAREAATAGREAPGAAVVERAPGAAEPARTGPDVEIAEPPPPHRIRRPVELVHLVLTLIGLGLVLLAAAGASATTAGVDSDLLAVGRRLPSALVGTVAVASALVGLVVVPVLVVVALVRRRLWRAGMIAAAAPLAVGLTTLVSWWLRTGAPARVTGGFVPLQATSTTPVLSGFLAGIVAGVVAGGVDRRLRSTVVLTVAAAVGTGLLSGTTTILATLTVLGLGRVAGLLVRIAAGSASVRPHGAQVAEALADSGAPLRRLEALPGGAPRRYAAVDLEGRPLDVVVLDRDDIGSSLVALAWRTLRTRGEARPREELTLERAVERRSVLSLAAAAAGVRGPRLVATARAGPDAAVLAYSSHEVRRLRDLSGDAVGDAALADVWRQVALLHRAGIAHRSLSPTALRLDAPGRVWVYEAVTGEVAATPFARQLDVAHALVALATCVGPGRAVASARAAVPAAALAAAVPLLQAFVLPRATRAALSDHPQLLADVRHALLDVVEAPTEPPVALERFRPRTLLTALGLSVAVYLIGTELVGVDFASAFRNADWRWIAVGLLAVAGTYVGTAAALLGFVQQRVPYLRTIAAQLALSFVKLFAPSAVGNAAVNIRLLTKAGVPAGAAAASIAAGQLAAFVVTLPLLLVLSVLTGTAVASGLTPSPAAIGVVVGVVGVLALLLLVRPVRERLRRLWRSFVDQGLPQLLEAVQTPHKLVQGVGGNLLLTFGYSLALYACVKAVGGDIGAAAVAVVFLTGNTVGSAVPTPGGLGAVEAALAAGLGAAGVGGGLAVPAVLLFRILSFWLPLLPGYLCWTRMQARGTL